jgi:parvulin-like peptidyl-prolyl isomerase
VGAKGRQRRKAAGRPAPAGRSAGRQRLGLIVFGALLVILFAIFAVAQGIGAPSVPSGDVALVEGVPSDFDTVSLEAYERAFERQTKSSKGKPPQPGEPKYAEAQEAALGELLDTIWIRGEAEEMGLSVTEKQIDDEFANIKKQQFPTKEAYAEFLKESAFTPAEVHKLVEVQLLIKKIQEAVAAEAAPPSNSEIEAYYEAEKEKQFTTPASRDIRIIVNKGKAKVEEAKAALEKDNSPASWKKVASEYSSDPTTKSKGGLQAGITEEFITGPLKAAIFDSATNEVVGPIKFESNYFLVEPVKLTPAKTKTLGEVRSQISQTLQQTSQQERFAEFVAGYESKWRSRTHCASGFVIKKCSNYRGTGHPTSAPPSCYEADPKTPPKECPSVVTPISPALPGSVTETKPKGEPFPQRPIPVSSGQSGAEALEGVPTEAPPTGE